MYLIPFLPMMNNPPSFDLTFWKDVSSIASSLVTIPTVIIGLCWGIPQFEQNYRKVNYEQKIQTYTEFIARWGEFRQIINDICFYAELERKSLPDLQQAQESFEKNAYSTVLHEDKLRQFEYSKVMLERLTTQRGERFEKIQQLHLRLGNMNADFLRLIGKTRFLSSDPSLYQDLTTFCDAIYWPGEPWENISEEKKRYLMTNFQERVNTLIDRFKIDTELSASVMRQLKQHLTKK